MNSIKKRNYLLGFTLFFAFIAAWALPTDALAQSQGQCRTPILVIVLDKSCSMGDRINASQTKWGVAISAIKQIVNQYKNKLRFGLITFSTSAKVEYKISQCISAGNNCSNQMIGVLNKLRYGGQTNLTAAINEASKEVTPIRQREPFRKISIMFITDGRDSYGQCPTTTVNTLRSALKVRTYVIGFGSGVDPNCLNNMAISGATALAGFRKYYQADNTTELNNAMKAIANAASAEVCNNIDDDCDGLIDEGLSRACNSRCGPGTQTCSKGKWGICKPKVPPKPEVCNGKDDDCDGKIDNGLRRTCRSKCGKGVETCQNGRWVNCNAPKPKPETCNGKDDDCDGKIDNGLFRTCQTKCGTGKETCQNGKWVNCTGPKPKPETCNGKDDDCDGQIDEGLFRPCQTKCGSGRETCQNGRWINCDAPKPKPEACNNRDDDCDGQIDEGTTSPRCPKCVKGLCAKKCVNECPSGFKCVNGICEEDPCRRIRCGRNAICRDGKCVDICAGVKCAAGEICVKGSCKKKSSDCRELGCPKGQFCHRGVCKKDPCHGVVCKGNTFCRDGKCVNSCADVVCDQGYFCRDGKCILSPCKRVKCPKGQFCHQGKCIKPQQHPCANVTCQKGQFCKDGKCVDDPCSYITCPPKQTCYKGQCYGGSTPPPKEEPIPGVENPTGGTDERPSAAERPSSADAGTSPTPSPDGGGQNSGGTPTVDGGSSSSSQNADLPAGTRNVRKGSGCVCTGNSPFPFEFMAFFLLLLGLTAGRKRISSPR